MDDKAYRLKRTEWAVRVVDEAMNLMEREGELSAAVRYDWWEELVAEVRGIRDQAWYEVVAEEDAAT